ncbi:hypothetical protein B0O80DRAFT_255798 [Mortierella sp. GBAus27b]|nr:hypothetical protein B0O80DRAFT_255798 [Mortierella sp. GBAus27b]
MLLTSFWKRPSCRLCTIHDPNINTTTDGTLTSVPIGHEPWRERHTHDAWDLLASRTAAVRSGPIPNVYAPYSHSNSHHCFSFRNLIDIPSTLQVERIQQQDAQIRSNEYTIALSTVKLPQQTIRKLTNMTNFKAAGADPPGVNDVLETDVGARTGNAPINGRVRSSTSSGSSIKAPSVREVLAEKTVDPKTVGWMASVVGELQQATESIDVEDVGDLIATLSPPVIRV